MTREEAQKILAMWRAGGHEADDPFFAEALQQVSDDPELAQWFEEEQEFDRAFAAKLADAPVPAELRTRIVARTALKSELRTPWIRRAALAAAAIVVLALIFNALRAPRASLDEFRGEMISFVKLAPPLELETSDLAEIQRFLRDAEAPAPGEIAIPPALKALEAAGCRVLSFRGHKVTLICFKRGNGKLAHLLVLDRADLLRLPAKAQPEFAPEGEWMTAAWKDGDLGYVLAAQGDETLLQNYLSRL